MGAELAYGLLAAFGSNIFFGSFGVPIKTPAVIAAQVDPVVFQIYKTIACFVTCFFALFYVDPDSAKATNAGRFHNVLSEEAERFLSCRDLLFALHDFFRDFKFTYWGVVGAAIWVVNGTLAIYAVQKAGLGVAQSVWSGLSIFVSFFWGTVIFGEPVRSMASCFLALTLMSVGMIGLALAAAGFFKDKKPNQYQELHADEDVGAGKYSRTPYTTNFQMGMMAATYVGVANGSFMTPLKYANQEVTGAEYLVSFGIGAMLVTIVFGSTYFGLRRAMGMPIPSMHVEVAAKPALLTGLLWSCGNVCSIFATEYLGIAIGWPIVQCQLVVSNLWGIFYYGEITGQKSIMVFLGSALVLLGGVVVLSVYGK